MVASQIWDGCDSCIGVVRLQLMHSDKLVPNLGQTRFE